MKLTMIELFARARARSEPIIAISTPDPAATMRDIAAIVGDAPRIAWDVTTGLRAVNDPAGKQALATAYLKSRDPKLAQAQSIKPSEALIICQDLPEGCVIFFHNMHNFLQDPTTQQAIWNCRDRFKQIGKTLVLMSPAFGKLPPAIANDVLTLEEPLPDTEALEEIVKSQFAAIRENRPTIKVPNKVQMEKIVNSIKGLAAYPAEQAVAMSLDKDGLDQDVLWNWKRQIVEQTPGLTFDRETFTFDDIGGIERSKTFGRMLFEGNQPPAIVIRIEEIEKAFAGSGGDSSSGGESSGVTQDQVGSMLTAMEDNGWNGMIGAGPAGSGKTLFSKALANTFGVPAMCMDLGAAKSKWVGESQQNIRQQLKVIKAIAGNRAFFVATSNNVENLPAALLRRFKAGIWVFDLPDEAEKVKIWQIQMAHWKVGGQLPDDTGYSGADIRNVCELAHMLKCSLVDAATFTICVSQSKPEVIEHFRETAHGRYLSASYKGMYSRPDDRKLETAGAGRRFN